MIGTTAPPGVVTVALSASTPSPATTTPVVSISEIQTPTGNTTDSPYAGQNVTTHGVVTAVTSDGFFIQNGSGQYRGVFVFTDNPPSFSVGDEVNVTAPVKEFFGLTELDLTPSYASATKVGNASVPAPVALDTGNASEEPYEGVLIAVSNLTVTSTPDENGEWDVDDGTGELAIDNVDAGAGATPNRTGATIDRLVGPLYYSFGEFKIQPTTIVDLTEPTPVTVLAYNDIGAAAAGGSNDTLGRMIHLLNARRAAAPGPTFVVGGGDEISPHAMRTLEGFDPPLTALNTIDPDAEVVQNHELDYDEAEETGDFSIFESVSNQSTFPWVLANVLKGNQTLPGTQNYTVVERGGVRVGIFGVADGSIDSKAGNVLSRNGWRIADPAPVAQRITDTLRTQENVDVVIAAAPLGVGGAQSLARSTTGIDVIVTGDDQQPYPPQLTDGTVITETGGNAGSISEINLTVVNGSVTSVDGRLIDVPAAEPRNASWASYIDQLRSQYGFDRVIVNTSVPLDAGGPHYDAETVMGNVLTDGVRNFTGADVAITNAGGIRSDAAYGPQVTAGNIRATLSFGNTVVLLRMTGAQLKTVLRSQMTTLSSTVFAGPGIATQVSGVTFEWVPHATPAQRGDTTFEGDGVVREVSIGGEPLNESATYTVATNSYIADGGSFYPMNRSMWVREYNTTMAEAVIQYLNRTGALTAEAITPAEQGRMRRVDRDTTATVNYGDDTVTVTIDRPANATAVTSQFWARTDTPGRLDAINVTADNRTIAVTFNRSAFLALAAGSAAGVDVYGKYNDSAYSATIRQNSIHEYAILNAEVSAIQPGDVDASGTINTGDVIQVQRSIVGLSTDPAFSPTAADVNNDGTVNTGDVIQIQREIVGLASVLD